MTQFEFSLQHDLNVTGNTTREFIGFANWLIKWRNFKAIETTYNTRECLCCITQQVYIWVVYGFCESRCSTVYMNGTVAFTSTEGLHNASPKHAQRTQFSNFHEEVCTQGECKHHALSNGMNIDVALCQLPHVANSCCQCIGNLLHIVGTAISVYITGYEHCFKLRCLILGPYNSMCHFIKSSI